MQIATDCSGVREAADVLGGGPCAGTEVGVEASLSRVTQVLTEATQEVALPASVCGQRIQALDMDTCETSPAVPLPRVPHPSDACVGDELYDPVTEACLSRSALEAAAFAAGEAAHADDYVSGYLDGYDAGFLSASAACNTAFADGFEAGYAAAGASCSVSCPGDDAYWDGTACVTLDLVADADSDGLDDVSYDQGVTDGQADAFAQADCGPDYWDGTTCVVVDTTITCDQIDDDGDGFSAAVDCDDSDADAYPGAVEIWGDGIDQDCDGAIDAESSNCEADLLLSLPNGTSTTLDGCVDLGFEASFEYDPDDPPEVVDFTLSLGATDGAGFDCRIELVQEDICGPGFYNIRDDTSQLTAVLMDCTGVSDAYEEVYTQFNGYLRLDVLDTGGVAGSFAGEPLLTTVSGYLYASGYNVDQWDWSQPWLNHDGVSLQGAFSFTVYQVADDGEEGQACNIKNPDVDGDGVLAVQYGGDDCDDWYNPSLGSQALDQDCDGFVTVDDCDDANSALPAADMDCDGTLTAADCDDDDPASTIRAEDGDCDGLVSTDDCDDSDATMPLADADCDGVLTVDDCGDDDPFSTTREEDADCDGSPEACVDTDDGVSGQWGVTCADYGWISQPQPTCGTWDDTHDFVADEMCCACSGGTSGDVCHGFDDRLDEDEDGVPDGCDVCPDFDDTVDTDGDGVPDGCDVP